MAVEFKRDGSVVELGDDFRIVHENTRQGWLLVSDRNRAFEILIGKKRDKALAAYRAQREPEPVVVLQPAQPKQEEPVPDLLATLIKEVERQEQEPPAVTVDESTTFLNAVTESNELYVPSPDEWFTAYFVRVADKILIFRLTTGDTVACRPRLVQSPGSHCFCLRENTEAAIRMELVDGRYRATECVIEGEPPAREEIGRIVNWNGCGWSERPCGCWIYVAYASRSREGICGSVGIGDWVRFRVEPSKTRVGTYVGVDAEKIESPEQDEEK